MKLTFPSLSVLAVLSLFLCSTRSATAATTTLTPQDVAWAGFVGSFTFSYYYEDVSTGRLIFAIMEPETRGFVRFDTTPIPLGSTIDGVRIVFWVSNHDLDGRAPCDKPAHIVQADVDPLVAPGATTFGAIGAGNTYADFTIGRTGPLYCMEYFEEWDLDLGPSGMADLELALANGYFTVGLQSEWPCDVSQDHVDWIGFNESLSVPDVGCTMLDRPGSRMRLEVEFTPPVVTCDIGSVMPIQNLLATKTADKQSVVMTWDADLEADGYNVWHVDTKDQVPMARSGGPGANPPTCAPAVTTDCTHLDAVPDGPLGALLYYQVRGACGAVEAAE